jgi:hypothetical protein
MKKRRVMAGIQPHSMTKRSPKSFRPLRVFSFSRERDRLSSSGGVVYSRVDGKLENFNPKPALDDFRSPTAAGIFFQVPSPMSKKTHLGIEARLFSENSATAFLYYGF